MLFADSPCDPFGLKRPKTWHTTRHLIKLLSSRWSARQTARHSAPLQPPQMEALDIIRPQFQLFFGKWNKKNKTSHRSQTLTLLSHILEISMSCLSLVPFWPLLKRPVRKDPGQFRTVPGVLVLTGSLFDATAKAPPDCKKVVGSVLKWLENSCPCPQV